MAPTLALSFRPPLAWEELLKFLAPRAIVGVEQVTADRYRRVLTVDGNTCCVEAGQLDDSALSIAVSGAAKGALGPGSTLTELLRDLFDLDAPIEEIDTHLATSRRLAPLVTRSPGLRVPGACDGFELAWRAVLGQQVSVAGATTLAGRFAAAFGQATNTEFPEIVRLTPTASDVASADVEQIAAIGLPIRRAATIRGVARLAVEQPEFFAPGCDLEVARTALLDLPGIGPWTASYIAMRAHRDRDAFLENDLGIKKALDQPTPQAAIAQAKAWHPYRAYAAMHLWSSL
ncbi:MAG: AlkA N-terminal domain-containing protein [Planctomycetota bacterium]